MAILTATLPRIRCAWPDALHLTMKPLTDRAIEKYARAGYYGSAMKKRFDTPSAKRQRKQRLIHLFNEYTF